MDVDTCGDFGVGRCRVCGHQCLEGTSVWKVPVFGKY